MLNPILTTKLKAYSLFAGGLIGSTTVLQADVIYTEIVPEVELPVVETDDYNIYTLSLNGDSSGSFYFLNRNWNQYRYIDGEYVNSTMFNYFLVRGLNGGSIAGTYDGPILNSVASMFDAGVMLGPDNNWIQPSSSLWYYGAVFFAHDHKHFPGGTLSDTFSSGEWLAATDKYVGMRFQQDGNYHYGWVRLSIDATTRTPTLTGFAYESDANASIRTGTEQIAIQNLFVLEGNASIANGFIKIQFTTSLSQGALLKIISLDGKVVMNQPVSGSEIKVPVPAHSVGTYILTIHTSEGDFIQKLLLQ